MEWITNTQETKERIQGAKPYNYNKNAFLISRNNHIIECNKPARELLGLKKKRIIGKRLDEIFEGNINDKLENKGFFPTNNINLATSTRVEHKKLNLQVFKDMQDYFIYTVLVLQKN